MGAELLELIVWLTPAGTEDEGGVKQPAYLNFDTALLGPPHGNQMQVRAFTTLQDAQFVGHKCQM